MLTFWSMRVGSLNRWSRFKMSQPRMRTLLLAKDALLERLYREWDRLDRLKFEEWHRQQSSRPVEAPRRNGKIVIFTGTPAALQFLSFEPPDNTYFFQINHTWGSVIDRCRCWSVTSSWQFFIYFAWSHKIDVTSLPSPFEPSFNSQDRSVIKLCPKIRGLFLIPFRSPQ